MSGSRRLECLDVIRGIAALAVVVQHIFFLQGKFLHDLFMDVISPGRIGVVTFFLVSGFIIPVSLERVTDIRKFR